MFIWKQKRTYYVCMAWVIFVCWCAGAIWTGSDDRIHFARPFGPFIARNVSTSVRPSKRKGHGFAWPESLESAAGRNFWWLHYLLINCLTKINFLYCADISNVIRPIVTSSPRQSSNQVWKQFAHFDFSRTVEPPSLWMHFPVRTFPTLRTGSFPSFSHGLPSCI